MKYLLNSCCDPFLGSDKRAHEDSLHSVCHAPNEVEVGCIRRLQKNRANRRLYICTNIQGGAKVGLQLFVWKIIQ